MASREARRGGVGGSARAGCRAGGLIDLRSLLRSLTAPADSWRTPPQRRRSTRTPSGKWVPRGRRRVPRGELGAAGPGGSVPCWAAEGRGGPALARPPLLFPPTYLCRDESAFGGIRPPKRSGTDGSLGQTVASTCGFTRSLRGDVGTLLWCGT